jgi:very-short-patch-repair endonuclease
MNLLALRFEQLGFELELPPYTAEFRLIPGRKFRVDYYYPSHKVIVELEGGIFVAGRHVRAIGYSNDCYKYSLLSLLGYKLIRLTSIMLDDGRAAELLKLAFGIQTFGVS